MRGRDNSSCIAADPKYVVVLDNHQLGPAGEATLSIHRLDLLQYMSLACDQQLRSAECRILRWNHLGFHQGWLKI